ncbi:type III-B CRISPR module-associated protein Cmr3 [Candidatus Parcubacteria bacterium]|nr:MAG: type III-B CRISPR module-associated protein Cmr3 [Candidatus Parcubacteria bacterium]
MRFALTPLDVFFFRDGRPFDRGEGWASGIFPPLPSTLYGAFRAAGLSRAAFSFKEFRNSDTILDPSLGTYKNLGNFSIRSATLHDSNGPLIPMPLDLQRNGLALPSFVPNPVTGIVTDRNFSLFQPADPEDDTTPYATWINSFDLEDYLSGRQLKNAGKKKERFRHERKTGIEKGVSGTAVEGMLYTQEMVRLDDGLHLSVETEHCSFLGGQGALKIGHDGRPFLYRAHPGESHFDSLKSSLQPIFVQRMRENGSRFKIIFTSPALFKKGWRSERVSVDYSNGEERHIWDLADGLCIVIESVVLGRPMRVGGWNMKTNKPRPMYRAVPPGSLYYCRLQTGDPSHLFNSLFDTRISETESESELDMKKQGFGHILLGLPCD